MASAIPCHSQLTPLLTLHKKYQSTALLETFWRGICCWPIKPSRSRINLRGPAWRHHRSGESSVSGWPWMAASLARMRLERLIHSSMKCLYNTAPLKGSNFSAKTITIVGKKKDNLAYRNTAPNYKATTRPQS